MDLCGPSPGMGTIRRGKFGHVNRMAMQKTEAERRLTASPGMLRVAGNTGSQKRHGRVPPQSFGRE